MLHLFWKKSEALGKKELAQSYVELYMQTYCLFVKKIWWAYRKSIIWMHLGKQIPVVSFDTLKHSLKGAVHIRMLRCTYKIYVFIKYSHAQNCWKTRTLQFFFVCVCVYVFVCMCLEGGCQRYKTLIKLQRYDWNVFLHLTIVEIGTEMMRVCMEAKKKQIKCLLNK